MRYILGVDSGGTKTESVLVRLDGTVVGWGRWAALESTATHDDGGRSVAAVQASIRQALGDTIINRLHIVNTGNGLPTSWLLPDAGAMRITLRQVVESDTMFYLAPGQKALVALAGTGSHVAGRDGHGNRCTLDGLGPYLGDYGGAVSIGCMK